MNLAQSLAPEGILVNTVSPGSFLSEGMRAYLVSLPVERGVDPDSLVDAMRVIEEDFGHTIDEHLFHQQSVRQLRQPLGSASRIGFRAEIECDAAQFGLVRKVRA